MNARGLDRLPDSEAVVEHIDDELQDGGAQTDRPGASDHEARPSPLEDDRRRHHARQPVARRSFPAARVQVLLPQHVVHVDPGSGHDHA
jgi:hypothetical protein